MGSLPVGFAYQYLHQQLYPIAMQHARNKSHYLTTIQVDVHGLTDKHSSLLT